MDVIDLRVPIVKVAGLVLFKGLLADPQMEGVLFGTGIDGAPIEQEFVPRKHVDSLLARINDLEAQLAGAEKPAPLMLLANPHAEAMP